MQSQCPSCGKYPLFQDLFALAEEPHQGFFLLPVALGFPQRTEQPEILD